MCCMNISDRNAHSWSCRLTSFRFCNSSRGSMLSFCRNWIVASWWCIKRHANSRFHAAYMEPNAASRATLICCRRTVRYDTHQGLTRAFIYILASYARAGAKLSHSLSFFQQRRSKIVVQPKWTIIFTISFNPYSGNRLKPHPDTNIRRPSEGFNHTYHRQISRFQSQNSASPVPGYRTAVHMLLNWT